MSKKRRKPQRQRKRASPAASAKPAASPEPSAKAVPLAEQATDLQLEAMVAADELGVVAVEPSEVGEDGERPSENDAVAAARAAQATFELLREKVQAETAEQVDLRKEVDDALASLKTDRATLEADRLAASSIADESAARVSELDSRKADLDQQAAEAEAGFLARQEEILGPIKERIAELTAAWHEQEVQLVQDWDEKLRERTVSLQQTWEAEWVELAEDRKRLDSETNDLRAKEATLARQKAELETTRDLLDEDRQTLDGDRTSIGDRAVRETAARLREAEGAKERLLARIDELEQANLAVEILRTELGGDPSRLLTEVQDLRLRVRTLDAELSRRPQVEVLEELDDARQRLADSARDRDEVVRAQRELERQLNYQSAEIGKVEQLELTSQALESSIGAYQSEIVDLTARFNQLRADTDRQTAFPECREMDSKYGGSTAPDPAEVPDLAEFADDLRYRMANDRGAAREGKRLNYREPDIRVFLAGLAMSRLHLLEGVSGTGKTTLPHAFAAAVGGGVKKIEVQAGWRDKQDLLGYYNSFERVYRETACLQYLYRACLPPFADRLIFIVLDEMNLSHPEQYFADFLSGLEDPKAQPVISIVDRALPDIPEKMQTDAGVQLPLAPNVWFIGTANQDETTFSFAPKTYDRAHVMELKPNAPETPDRPDSPRPGPVSFTSLQDAFERAQKTHAQQASTAARFVRDLSDFFTEKFRVGWGNRLELHIDRFVPVDIASGGSLGEALDHIVATKVLRKIQGRYSVTREPLEELAEQIGRTWPDPSHSPKLTTETIEQEIRDLDFR